MNAVLAISIRVLICFIYSPLSTIHAPKYLYFTLYFLLSITRPALIFGVFVIVMNLVFFELFLKPYLLWRFGCSIRCCKSFKCSAVMTMFPTYLILSTIFSLFTILSDYSASSKMVTLDIYIKRWHKMHSYRIHWRIFLVNSFSFISVEINNYS